MKKALIAVIVSLGVAVSSVPAKADNKAGLIIGGIIGGLVIGTMIDHDRRYNRQKHNHYHEPRYRQVCYTEWIGYYDHKRGYYVRQPREFCHVVKNR